MHIQARLPLALSAVVLIGCSEPEPTLTSTPRPTTPPVARPSADTETAELLRKTAALHRDGHYQEGLVRLESAIRRDPERPRLHYNLGIFRASLGEYEAATTAFEEELARFPGHAESHRALATAYTRIGRLEDSIPHFEICRDNDADDVLCTFQLGQNYSSLGLFEEARGPLERAAEIRLDADAYAELGVLYRRLGDLDLATATFAKALAEDPRHLVTLLGYGQVLTAIGRQEDGEALLAQHQHLAALQDQLNAFERAKAQSGVTPEAFLDLARLHLERDDRAAAAAALREALELDEGNARAALELAGLSLKDNRLDEAERYIHLALTSDPNNPAPSFFKALLHLKRGDGQAATQAIATSRKLGGWPITAYKDLGDALHANGDFRSARQVYAEGLRIDPEHAPLHYNLARTQVALGEREAAQLSVREATRLDPDLSEAWQLLGVMLHEAGDVAAGNSAFRRVLSLERRTRLRADGPEQLLRDFPGSDATREAFRRLLSPAAS